MLASESVDYAGGCIFRKREGTHQGSSHLEKLFFLWWGGELGRVIGDGTVLHHIGHFLFKLILATTALEIYIILGIV